MITKLQNILTFAVFFFGTTIQTDEFCSIEDKICSSPKISKSNTR